MLDRAHFVIVTTDATQQLRSGLLGLRSQAFPHHIAGTGTAAPIHPGSSRHREPGLGKRQQLAENKPWRRICRDGTQRRPGGQSGGTRAEPPCCPPTESRVGSGHPAVLNPHHPRGSSCAGAIRAARERGRPTLLSSFPRYH